MNSFKRLLLIIVISLLPFVTIFVTPLAPHTHDSPVHYARIAAYYKALSEGQILPRWASELNYGYGMPLFNFIYHVPYLVSSVAVALGSGLVLSFKLSMALCFVLSGVFMYLFAKKFLKDERRAWMVMLLYQFAPFHLIDLVVRGDLAEGYALAFLPLVLLAVVTAFEEKNKTLNILRIGCSVLLLVTSHNAISLVFFGIITLFIIVFAPDNKKRLETIMGLTLGLGLASFYWIPAIIERKYTYGDLFMKDMYASHFAPLLHFLIPNVTNASALQTGGIAVSFGLIPVAALTIAVIRSIQKRIRPGDDRTIVLFCLFLTAVALFFMQPVSRPFWAMIPILRMFQFPWRLLNITSFSLALLGGTILVSKKTPRWIIWTIGVVAVLSAFVYFKPPLGQDRIDEAYYWNYPLNTTFFGETDVIWSAGPANSYPKNRFEVIGGDGTVTDSVKRGTEHTFTVNAVSDVQVVDRTQYFPGWRVFADSKKIPIEFQDQNWRGLITFRLSPGIHHIRVIWGESVVRQIADGVTIASLGISLILFVYSVRKKYT